MAEPATETGLDEGLEVLTRERMARWHIPGATVGELSGGASAVAGFGVASLETGYPIRADSLFQIGSITKIFTATLVMMLVEEGKLDLDQPVHTYLPELKLADSDARERITLRMLLCHSAGFFGDYFEDFGMGDDALSRYVARLDTLEQQTPVGTSWAYNNAGFCLAGAVIERVCGEPYERVVRRRIFEPLGLTHTFFFAHEAITYPVSVGHTQITPARDEHEVARLYPLPRAVNPAGGVISSVSDLLTFAAFHLDGGVTRDGKRLLAEAATRAMWEPRMAAANFAEAYGTGWETRRLDGVRVVGHGGSTNGFNARLLLIPERRYALVILTNSGRGSAMYQEILEARLAERFGLQAPQPQPIKLPRKALARFAGVYTLPDVRVEVVATASGLRATTEYRDVLSGKNETYPPQLLRPIGEREFIITEPEEAASARVDFLLDDAGLPRFLRSGGRLHRRATS
ncbi:MAG TPA: serine hydrolase domain-containing protein [Ktedonobacterales bacterium]